LQGHNFVTRAGDDVMHEVMRRDPKSCPQPARAAQALASGCRIVAT
jgi:hypothetical protein